MGFGTNMKNTVFLEYDTHFKKTKHTKKTIEITDMIQDIPSGCIL
jgi:hypothetical protein